MAHDFDAYKKRVATLPQASVLVESDVDRWLDGMFERARAAEEAGEMAVDINWHIDRARGIGGSEAGVGLLHKRKEYWFDVNLPKLVDEKLLKRLPDPSNHHMERGTYLEDCTRLIFHELSGVTSDTAGRNLLATSAADNPSMPWLVGNEDDLVLSGSDPATQKRFLADYKMAAQSPSDVPMMYAAQLHHYWMRCMQANIQVDGLLLANVTIPGAETWVEAIKNDPDNGPAATRAMAHSMATAAKNNPDVSPLSLFSVDKDPAFAKELVQANAEVWNRYVMEGTRPRFFRRPTVELTDEQKQTGSQIAERIARRKALIDAAEAANAQDEDAMRKLVAHVALKGKKAPFAQLSLSRRSTLDKDKAGTVLQQRGVSLDQLTSGPTYDVTAMLDQLREHGHEPADFIDASKPKYDTKKIQSALEDQDMDSAEFSNDKTIVGLSRARKGPGFEAVTHIRHAAETQAEIFVQRDLSDTAMDAEAVESTDDSTARPAGSEQSM